MVVLMGVTLVLMLRSKGVGMNEFNKQMVMMEAINLTPGKRAEIELEFDRDEVIVTFSRPLPKNCQFNNSKPKLCMLRLKEVSKYARDVFQIPIPILQITNPFYRL